MSDNFVDSLLSALIDLMSPKDAEGKVVAGDKEAANILTSMQGAGSNSTVLAAAEKLPGTATVYGSLNKLLPGHPFPISQSNLNGLYYHDSNDIYLDVARPLKAVQGTLRHELGHFLHRKGTQYPVDTKQPPQYIGLDDEAIADIIGNRIRAPISGDAGVQKFIKELYQMIYGKTTPFVTKE